MAMQQGIKNIIFDLGGVLLDIDYTLTIKAFEKLGIKNFELVFSQFKQSRISDLFETGKISEKEFYQNVTKELSITRAEFDNAWNAMLLDFPKERFDLLKTIREKYNLYLCSNTNSIHHRAFFDIINQFEEPFETLFDRVYYSHEVGLRKPNPLIFEHILQENNLKPEETVFLDDSPQHLEGARALGIKTILVKKKTILEIFVDLS